MSKMNWWIHFHVRTALLAVFLCVLLLVRCASSDLARVVTEPKTHVASTVKS